MERLSEYWKGKGKDGDGNVGRCVGFVGDGDVVVVLHSQRVGGKH